VIGWLEDDFHHFGLKLRHENGVIVDLTLVTKRLPYSTCGGAIVPLRALIGMSLPVKRGNRALLSPTLQCTHMMHVADLMLNNVANGQHRRYEAIVEDRPQLPQTEAAAPVFGQGRAQLLKDGSPILDWQLDGEMIVLPEPFAGRSYLRHFSSLLNNLDLELAEAASVLRGAVFVSGGRSVPRRDKPIARSKAVCHTYQLEQLTHANSTHDVRDWSSGSAGMLNAREELA